MIGFLNINKPVSLTSAKTVSIIKHKFKIKKIGHMGTLDPFASGILPIAIGKATRLFDFFLKFDKTYIADFDFGFETDTLDYTGNITYSGSKIPTTKEITDMLKCFEGKILQLPPKYSAKKVDGVRAYTLARNNVDFQLKHKEIEIKQIQLLEKKTNSTFRFKISCSSGTYIRSICRDLAHKLNSHATITQLIRCKSGTFVLENAVDLETLKQHDSIEMFILKIDEVFNFPKYNATEFEYCKLINGVRLENNSNILPNTFLYYENNLVGLLDIKEDKVFLKLNLED